MIYKISRGRVLARCSHVDNFSLENPLIRERDFIILQDRFGDPGLDFIFNNSKIAMDVYKTNGSYEEYDREKLIRGIHEAYKTAGQECPEAVVISIVDNLYIYDKIASKEIRRQVEESLMSINKKVALAYIE